MFIKSLKMTKNIYKNQKGAVAIMMTILILASILSITMIANTIILNNLSMNIVQVGATKAFFASEAGAEKMLWEIRKKSLNFTSAGINCSSGKNICFPNDNIAATSTSCAAIAAPCTASAVKDLALTSNASKFRLLYEQPVANATTTITSYGVYGDTARNTQIDY